ncbi:MAG: hypothetical protein BWX73_03411 [Lentisphaerae bacterium ADurb.Bin082]|nr:MAG: hypothetical protein BWX73_03411 [Lentisphaerae bacterium ADurb.Bin082]
MRRAGFSGAESFLYISGLRLKRRMGGSEVEDDGNELAAAAWAVIACHLSASFPEGAFFLSQNSIGEVEHGHTGRVDWHCRGES